MPKKTLKNYETYSMIPFLVLRSNSFPPEMDFYHPKKKSFGFLVPKKVRPSFLVPKKGKSSFLVPKKVKSSFLVPKKGKSAFLVPKKGKISSFKELPPCSPKKA